MSSKALLLEMPGGGSVLFGERTHGNASSVGGEGSDDGARVREHLRELAGLRALARGYQVHGSTVRRVRVPPHPENGAQPDERADGQATALRLVGATVLTADCLPIALGGDGAVAMVHAGWRGLAAGVLEEGVRAARELGGVTPTHAIIGPGAGVCCYEVGAEVHDAFAREQRSGQLRDGQHRSGQLRSGEHGAGQRVSGGHIDLHAIAKAQLLAAGVREVLDLELCTICDERFFSHRREGESAGRQAAIAWLS